MIRSDCCISSQPRLISTEYYIMYPIQLLFSVSLHMYMYVHFYLCTFVPMYVCMYVPTICNYVCYMLLVLVLYVGR